jgi:hypothetical protein
VSVIGLYFMRKYLDYWELQKIAIVRWIYRVDRVKGGLWFFVKLVKQSRGELKCVVFLFLCVLNLKDDVMSTSLCNSFGLRDLCYQM